MRMIQLLIRSLVSKEKQELIDENKIDDAIESLSGVKLNADTNPEFLKQMIVLSSRSNEEKKAIAILCLHLKNHEGQFTKIIDELYQSLRWGEISKETENILKNELKFLMK